MHQCMSTHTHTHTDTHTHSLLVSEVQASGLPGTPGTLGAVCRWSGLAVGWYPWLRHCGARSWGALLGGFCGC